MNGEGRILPPSSAEERGAHGSQRIHYPAHGTSPKRSITGEHTEKRPACKQSCQEPKRRPRIARIKDRVRFAQRLRPTPEDSNASLTRLRDLCAKRSQGMESPETVLALEEPMDLGQAVSHGTQDHAPV
jgi:hypothetical protein